MVFSLHQIYENSKEALDKREAACRDGSLACSDCKADLLAEMNKSLAPIRERREKLAADKNLVTETLKEGSRRAQLAASRTQSAARRAIHFNQAGA